MGIGDAGQFVGGRYRVDRELGRGQGTQSLLVTDLRSGRPCVLRRLSPEAASPAAARRFEAQAAILAKLDYPGLPRFIDSFSEGEGDAAARVVVTSYHPGESLERLIAKGRPLTESQALVLLRRMVPVLAYLHSFEPPLVHRAIAAAGIILGPDGRPCLTDLDFAIAGQPAPTPEQTPPGPDELALAAPEVFMGGAVPASDIYALGLAICRGMTARDPAALLREGARVQLRGALGVSEAFAAVLGRMLEPSLERRYADTRALDADLARLAGVRVPPARAAEEPKPSREVRQPVPRTGEEPHARRSARPLILAGVAGALIVLAAFAVRLRTEPEPATSLLVSPAPQAPGDASSPQPAVPAPSPTADPAPPAASQAPPAAAPAESPASSSAAAPEPGAAPSASGGVAAGPGPAPAEPLVKAPPPSLPAPAPPADTTPPDVAGRLLFDGELFSNTAAPAPSFWFRREGTKTEVKPQVDYAAGLFTIRGLSPGRYAMSVRIDLERGNPKTYPGDLTAWEEVTLEAGKPAALDVSLRTIMHLVQPVDNGAVISGWDVPCGAGNVHPGSVVFAWDALGPDTRYDVSVDRLVCGSGFTSAGRALTSYTTEAWIKLDLPPNKEGECYAFKLTANRGGRTIGIMNTHGRTGIGWDYRFSVPGR